MPVKPVKQVKPVKPVKPVKKEGVLCGWIVVVSCNCNAPTS